MKYYVIYYNEDGDPPRCEIITKDDLLKRLDDEYWGSAPNMIDLSKNVENQSGLLIIKGEQITPRAARVVEAWEVD